MDIDWDRLETKIRIDPTNPRLIQVQLGTTSLTMDPVNVIRQLVEAREEIAELTARLESLPICNV